MTFWGEINWSPALRSAGLLANLDSRPSLTWLGRVQANLALHSPFANFKQPKKELFDVPLSDEQ